MTGKHHAINISLSQISDPFACFPVAVRSRVVEKSFLVIPSRSLTLSSSVVSLEQVVRSRVFVMDDVRVSIIGYKIRWCTK